jgi:hypothetical protein
MLLVALGCGRLAGILAIAARNSFVVLGTMDGNAFAGLAGSIEGSMTLAMPVYFYETG